MSLDDHDLERELASLVPRPPSPELEQRLAAALMAKPAARRRAYPTQALLTATAGLALTGLIVVMLARRTAERPSSTGDDHAAATDTAFDASVPTVWAYHRAVVDPQINLEELLDQHRGPAFGPMTTQSRAFPVSAFNNQSWRGEL